MSLSLIYAIRPGQSLPDAGALSVAKLPEKTQILLVCAPGTSPKGPVPQGAEVLSGEGELWQAGLAAATGDYVQFLSGGDTPLPYAHAAALDKAERYQADGLRCALLPLCGENRYADVPAYTLSKIDPGSLHQQVGLEPYSPLPELGEDPRGWLFRRESLNGLCPGEGDGVFLWRRLCRGGRFFVTRDNLCTISEWAQKEDTEQFVRLEQALTEDGADAETVQRLLRDKWNRLLQQGTDLAAFVRDYQGICAHWLEGDWRAARRQTPPQEQPAEELPVRRGRVEQPKVSVVLPIYNVEEYLNQALFSLERQNMEELEFLCVNDGSTDGSVTIIREYAARDGRFILLDGPNGGYGKAMNRGLDAARGAYMGILEPDDYVAPGMFKKLSQTAQREKLDFVKSNYFRFFVNRHWQAEIKRMYVSREDRWYDRVIDPAQEQEAFHLPMKTWNGIYRVDFLRENGIRHNETPGASYQDNGFWFQTMSKAHRILFLHNTFYHYRQDNPNSSINNTAKIYCITEEYRFIQRWLEQQGLWETFQGIYQAKRFHNFSTTYRRIAQEYRQEYLHHIQDEFLPLRQRGELRQECFEPLLWQQLMEILDDPEGYGTRIRVSVILPVYNCEAYLRQCLDSILMRNDQPIEVICVDDGSTDGSGEILAEYAAQDSRVRVVRQENAGAGAARNRGMEYAKGEYLSFLDADDFFDPEMLRKAYNKAHLDGSDIVVFRSQEYYEDTGRYLGMRSNIREEYLPDHAPFAGTEVEENIFRLFVGWAWDKLFRADFVRENGLRFQEQRTTNDLLFTYSAVVRAERISTMNNVLAYHRKAAGSLSVTREQSWDCFYKALLALRQQLKDWGLYQRFERDFVNYALHFSLWNLHSLRGGAYYKLFDKLNQSWLEELGILDKPRRYFYQPEQYDQLQKLRSAQAEDYLFDRLDEAAAQMEEDGRQIRRMERQAAQDQQRIQTLTQRNGKQKKEISALRKKAHERKKTSLFQRVLRRLRRLLGWNKR